MEPAGARLLGSCEEVGLGEVLGDVRALEEKSLGPSLAVPELDRLVTLFSSHPAPGQSTKLPNPPVIEITSLHSGAGATHLLYYLISHAVLSKTPSFNGWTAGKGGMAIVLDCNGTFDVVRLRQVLQHELLKSVSLEATEQQPEQSMAAGRACMDALTHVRVYAPRSIEALVATVGALKEQLLDVDLRPRDARDRAVELVAIDGLSAFYWPQKMAEERAQLERLDFASKWEFTKVPEEPSDPYVQLVENLREVQKVFRCAVVTTAIGLSSGQMATEKRNSLCLAPMFGNVWNAFCTVRLVVGRDETNKFHEDMLYEQMKRDAPERQRVVEQNRFTCWLDRWGSENWSRRLLDQVKDEGSKDWFAFRIFGKGVTLDVGNSQDLESVST